MLVSNIRAACYRLLQTLPMPSERPPTIDPIAAARWHASAPALSPWLHEEVARRMEARLQWIRTHSPGRRSAGADFAMVDCSAMGWRKNTF